MSFVNFLDGSALYQEGSCKALDKKNQQRRKTLESHENETEDKSDLTCILLVRLFLYDIFL